MSSDVFKLSNLTDNDQATTTSVNYTNFCNDTLPEKPLL